jgi:hypothetical protein
MQHLLQELVSIFSCTVFFADCWPDARRFAAAAQVAEEI